jgi:hypothetical protein
MIIMSKIITRIKFLDSNSKEFISRKLKDACKQVIDDYNENETIVSPVIKVGKYPNGDWDTGFNEKMESFKKANLIDYVNEEGVLDFEKLFKEFYDFLQSKSKGLSEGLSVENIAKKHNVSVEEIEEQLIKGSYHEKEHTDNLEEARKIAMDHLVEIPDYYDRLEEIEDSNKNIRVKDEEQQEVEISEEEINKAVEESEEESEETKTYQEYLEEELNSVNKSDFRYYLISIILGKDKGWSYLKSPKSIEGNEYDVVTPKNTKKILKIFKESNK